MRTPHVLRRTLAAFLILLATACDGRDSGARQDASSRGATAEAARPTVPAATYNRDWQSAHIAVGLRVAAAAEERSRQAVTYDPAYVRIPYPRGDVAADRGVCSDEVIRALRLVGVDLQQLVHEDMRRHFSAYPARWGMTRPDPNIDHRRVPNLATFFTRQGAALPVSDDGGDYLPGDIVAWELPGGLPHIGIVTERLSDDGTRRQVMHNIGFGPQIEDRLFAYRITGHFRYPKTLGSRSSPNGPGAPRATR